MQNVVYETVVAATGATHIELADIIQELWSGYGQILRYRLTGSSYPTVVVKHIDLTDSGNHPRGWNTDLGHQRKLHSYQVETQWYTHFAHHCSATCRVPQCLLVKEHDAETVIVLEDMDAAGFPMRRHQINQRELNGCLGWLAWFHATFMSVTPEGLWPQGTYWHLDTRPDELEALDDALLKDAAHKIDRKLKECQHQTLVHGDAKLANFCFSPDGNNVAAVDFQYVGGGCGMKDLAYFIGSCLTEEECEQLESRLLDTYFTSLKKALTVCKPAVNSNEVEAEWRELYPYAWTDFHRFLKGWSPDHWKLTSYSEKVAQDVIQQLA